MPQLPKEITDALTALIGSAQQRPDLLSESQGGPSFGSPDYRPTGQQAAVTFAGRMVRPGESLADVLKRVPVGEMESGGQGMSALPGMGLVGMAKTFRPGTSTLGARLAKPGTIPDTPIERMLAAVINEPTGEVMYQMHPYRAGDHGGLMTIAETLKDWKPVRGFVDPATFDAFTEAMLEEALMKRKGFLP